MRRLPFALVAPLLLAPAFGVFAQDAVSAVELAALASLTEVPWDPSWPAELPPDAFAATGGRPSSVEVSLAEAEAGAGSEGEPSAPYLARWDSAGRPAAFPFFLSGSRFDLSVVRDASGRISRASVAGAAAGSTPEGGKAATEDAARTGPKAAAPKPAAPKGAAPERAEPKPDGTKSAGAAESTIVLTYGADGAPASAVSEAEGGVSYSSFSRSGSAVDEIRYDESGLAVSRETFTVAARGVATRTAVAEDGTAASVYRRDYDAGGRTTRLEGAEGTVDVVYDKAGRPVSVRSEAGERRLQWDERGLIVREIETGADGKRVERAFSYAFNERRDWIERRSFVYEERFGLLVGAEGPAVVRSIRYRR
jgi:YD repeat-containing protein